MYYGSILTGRHHRLEGEDHSGSEGGLFGGSSGITFQFTQRDSSSRPSLGPAAHPPAAQGGSARRPWSPPTPASKLIKTSDLDPSHNYLFGFHPHGVLVAGAFGNFCTEYSGFKELFPGLTPYLHILPFWFSCPFFREYIMSAGLVSASKKSVSYVLKKSGGGNISVIVIGGAEESLNAHPGSLTLSILKRKGFIKMALKFGAHLVPVFSFGENELFKQVANPKGSWLRNLQSRMQKVMGFALPLFHARGIFQYSFGLMPYRKPVHTVVGSPIAVKQSLNPTAEEIEQLHQTYLQELKTLFEEHKGKYGIPQHETLVFE